jgi:hypothetical protein
MVRFVCLATIHQQSKEEGLNIAVAPVHWVVDQYRERLKNEKQEQHNKTIQEARYKRKLAHEAERKEEQARRDTEEREYKVLAAKKQFTFNELLIQRKNNSTAFYLPNENNKKITAYDVIKRLAGKDFKSYKKQIHFKNNKIQILPISERIRLVFHFRRQYKSPLSIANADTIAAFINTAIKYTNNRQLKQNWYACLEATGEEREAHNILDCLDTLTHSQKNAASLFTCYGWASEYDTQFPVTENAFYTVNVTDGERHYNIVNDDIALRFAAIENYVRGMVTNSIIEIIKDNKPSYTKKFENLENLLFPLLWWRNNIRLGLTQDDKFLCYDRIKNYIEELLSHNAFDNITIEEHISKVVINDSDTSIIFAPPQAFVISLDDMTFSDHTYNINAEYNKVNAAKLGAARSKKAACNNFAHVTGDKWSAAELDAQGIDKDKRPRLVKNGLIEKEKDENGREIKGQYKRVAAQ